MFVVVPLIDGAEPRPFLTAKAAKEWAETGAFQEFEAEQSEVHFIDGDVSKEEAIAAVKDGRSEKRATITRRVSAREIEVGQQRETEAFLRGVGLWP